jgi:hypothetical protein
VEDCPYAEDGWNKFVRFCVGGYGLAYDEEHLTKSEMENKLKSFYSLLGTIRPFSREKDLMPLLSRKIVYHQEKQGQKSLQELLNEGVREADYTFSDDEDSFTRDRKKTRNEKRHLRNPKNWER